MASGKSFRVKKFQGISFGQKFFSGGWILTNGWEYFFNSCFFTGPRCFCTNLSSEQNSSTAFSVSLHWLWEAAALSSLWYSSRGPIASKVGILKVVEFPVTSDEALLPPGTLLISVSGLFSVLLSRSFSFSSSCCRERTCCLTSAIISRHPSVICCSILTKLACC